VAQIFKVSNPGISSRTYSTISGQIHGDVTILKRNDTAADYLAEAMSPIDKYWMNWSTSISGYPQYYETEEPELHILRMTKEITPYAMMNMIVVNDSVKDAAIHSMLNFGIDTSRVHFYYFKMDFRFIRDEGPIFLKGDQGHLMGIDFNYNCYGKCKPYSAKTELGTMDSVIEKQMGLQMLKTEVCSEGGDRDFNGKGTMLTVEAVELYRNKAMTKEQFEAEYKRLFGVKKNYMAEERFNR